MRQVTCSACKARLQFFDEVSGELTCPNCLAKLPLLDAVQSAPRDPFQSAPPRDIAGLVSRIVGKGEPFQSAFNFRFKLDPDTDIERDLKTSTMVLIGLAGLGFLGLMATFNKVLEAGAQPAFVTYVFAISLGLLVFTGVALRFFEDHPLARSLGQGILYLLGMVMVAVVAVIALLILLFAVCAALLA